MIYAIFLMISQAWLSTGAGRPARVEACDDPVLVGLFTPRHPAIGRYEVCTTPRSIADVIADANADAPRYTVGTVQALEPLDAFGAAGAYDRFAVIRLYGGTRARVARGWRDDGRVFESITLISPYPNASLTHLITGTMSIRWRTIIRSSS